MHGVYDGWIRGDFTGGEVFDPEVEFVMRDWPEGSRTRGLQAMAQAWQAALSAWDDFRAVPGEVHDAGKQVVVVTHVTARGKGSGIETSASTATLWTLEHGSVVRLELYWDSAKGVRGRRNRALAARPDWLSGRDILVAVEDVVRVVPGPSLRAT